MLTCPAVAMGATVQFRMMGGAIGLAVVTSVFNTYTQSKLSEILAPQQMDMVLDAAQTVGTLEPLIRHTVRMVLAKAYRLQLWIVVGTSVAQYLTTLLMWQKKPLKVA